MTTATEEPPVRVPSLAILIAISWVNPLALNIYVPSMPRIIEALHTDAATVQLTLSLFLASVAVAQLILGPVSDIFGRRPVVLIGMVVFVFASGLCSMAQSVEMLIVGRILQAAGGCSGIVLARSIVRDLFSHQRAASMIGYVTAGMAIAPLLGPAIGGVLDQFYGWRASFVLVTLLGAGVLVSAWLDLHETNRNRGRADGFGRMFSGFSILARYPLFWSYTFTMSFASGVFFGFLGAAPFVSSQVMGLSPAGYGLYFAMIAGGYMIGNVISGRFAEKVGTSVLIMAGGILCLAATLAMMAAFVSGLLHPLAMFGPMFFVGIANGLITPAAMAGVVSLRPEHAGAASGIAGSLQLGGGAIATFSITIAITSADGTISALPLAVMSTVFAVVTVISAVASRALERLEANA